MCETLTLFMLFERIIQAVIADCVHVLFILIAHSGPLEGGWLEDTTPGCRIFFATLPSRSLAVEVEVEYLCSSRWMKEFRAVSISRMNN